jgi:hypothetical protein
MRDKSLPTDDEESAPQTLGAIDSGTGEPEEAAIDEADLSLVELVRLRLDIGADLPDLTIAASLAAIAAKGDTRARWLAAFGSPLGRWLAGRGADLNTALNNLVALAPKAAS